VRPKRYNLAALGALTVLCAAQGNKPKCYVTAIVGKCGNDQVLSWVMCGNPPQQCNLLEETYGMLFRCEGADAGLANCAIRPCKKVTYIRACIENACVLTGQREEDVVDGTIAVGLLCPGVPGGPTEP